MSRGLEILFLARAPMRKRHSYMGFHEDYMSSVGQEIIFLARHMTCNPHRWSSGGQEIIFLARHMTCNPHRRSSGGQEITFLARHLTMCWARNIISCPPLDHFLPATRQWKQNFGKFRKISEKFGKIWNFFEKFRNFQKIPKK